MDDFMANSYADPTANGAEPAKKRGRKPGAVKKITARVAADPPPIPTDEIVAAVNTMLAWPENIRKSAIAIVTGIVNPAK